MYAEQCPECGSIDTKRIHAEWFSDAIEELRWCNSCQAQYSNGYELTDQMVAEYEDPS